MPSRSMPVLATIWARPLATSGSSPAITSGPARRSRAGPSPPSCPGRRRGRLRPSRSRRASARSGGRSRRCRRGSSRRGRARARAPHGARSRRCGPASHANGSPAAVVASRLGDPAGVEAVVAAEARRSPAGRRAIEHRRRDARGPRSPRGGPGIAPGACVRVPASSSGHCDSPGTRGAGGLPSRAVRTEARFPKVPARRRPLRELLPEGRGARRAAARSGFATRSTSGPARSRPAPSG